MAAITSAVVGTGLAVKGSIDAKKAAKRAGRAQERSSEAAQQEIARQFDVTQQNMQPFLEAGQRALTSQEALVGLSGPEAQAEAMQTLQESPGQRFIRKRQERALLRGSSAIGGLGGGNVKTALQEQAAGFAMQDLNNQFGRLGQIAGQGQNTASNLGQFGAQSSGAQANLMQTAGQARASGILGAQQAQSQGLGQVANLIGQFAPKINVGG